MSDTAASFLQQATQCLQSGQFDQALDLASQALAADPSSGEGYLLKGIALAQLHQSEAATQAFRQSISAAPENPKAYYNFATHLYQSGDKAEALVMAQRCLELEPSYAAARGLVQLIEQPETSFTSPAASYGTATGTSPALREGYETQAGGSVRFIENMGKTWVTLGWVISLLCLGVFIYSMVTTLGPTIEMFQNMEKAEEISKRMQESMGFMYYVMTVASWLINIAAILWCVFDLVNRRGNFAWLAAFIPCNCCGFAWLVMPVYLLLGRR